MHILLLYVCIDYRQLSVQSDGDLPTVAGGPHEARHGHHPKGGQAPEQEPLPRHHLQAPQWRAASAVCATD